MTIHSRSFRRSPSWHLDQFDKQTTEGGRVQEGDASAHATAPWLGVDQRAAVPFEACQYNVDVGDRERDVMQRGAALGDEALDRTRAGRLERLDVTVSCVQHSLDEPVGDLLVHHREPENRLQGGERIVWPTFSESDMMYAGYRPEAQHDDHLPAALNTYFLGRRVINDV